MVTLKNDHAKATAPKNPRPLDAIDRLILQVLMARGRIPNSTLAQTVSVAESTAHNRVHALIDSGVIRGVHADVDLAAVGRPLEALIQIQIQPSARAQLRTKAERLAHCPGVIEVYFLAGSRGLLVRVAMADSAGLRDFVLNELNQHAAVASTETSTVVEHFRGVHPLIAPT